MALSHPFFLGNNRIREAHEQKGRSIKPAPPHDDPDAVRRIQKALRALGFALPESFRNSPDGDGKYGNETYQAVLEFQRRAFPGDFREHDGRVGPKTLDEMDKALSRGKPVVIDPNDVVKPVTDILMFFTGFNDRSGGEDLNEGSGSFQFNDLKAVRRQGVRTLHKGFVGSLRDDAGPTRALQFIDKEFNGGKLILYGFSAGAKQLLELCVRLERRNQFRKEEGRPLIAVDLLVTNDAAGRENNGLVLRVVAGCVKRNLNLFQTKAAPSGSRGAANSSEESRLTGRRPVVINHNMDNQLQHPVLPGVTGATEHEQMERAGHPLAMQAIRAEMATSS